MATGCSFQGINALIGIWVDGDIQAGVMRELEIGVQRLDIVLAKPG